MIQIQMILKMYIINYQGTKKQHKQSIIYKIIKYQNKN